MMFRMATLFSNMKTTVAKCPFCCKHVTGAKNLATHGTSMELINSDNTFPLFTNLIDLNLWL